ncbi:multifunctional transcriptional regulator/nicotinamide-nucleotide adenylyltransferase/ribosylnicotinamide kinase NadR [Moraxella atlantae]|uniref:Trifunctional NAD biosynthesis/regulator protein NadR n=1 Tax=Faucicola atlantae TaxID=34059 RepID=A0A378Q5B7_9GAMM|nr:multifunctional transcriptional regulator/nicotinamide-nucleotide adenylyltransferase/ribosylnicotinamide kinase NadR [Moraxella atlantae]OPH36322.1 trifunctional nicotinamide-nucleotide adenylyltransferase/ribosylnicotinamide kinase/transcriptional regulator NadR [Moraxella atlantae]STY95594.1 Trifunctional NAD biosynthesis/regulator protein NadR [Moraxella atlantae]
MQPSITALTEAPNKPTHGVIIGYFQPLHLGHMQAMMFAAGQVEQLTVVVLPHPAPNPKFHITQKDKARWLTMALAHLPFVRVMLADDADLPAFDGKMTALDDMQRSALARLAAQIKAERGLTADDTLAWCVDAADWQTLGGHVAMLTLPSGWQVLPTPPTGFDSAIIHANPAQHWAAIHPEARASYTKTVAIVGGESSGKTTLLYKLVNHYGASYALEMGRVFVETDLGGTELGMQYTDYPLMATDHAQAIRAACRHALAPVTLIDTDFVTTQAFCEEYEGRAHPFLAACIDTFCLDYTLMLANNTPWVADGMRSLGTLDARQRFAARLTDIYARHQITPVCINDADYQARFLAAVRFIDRAIFGKSPTDIG